VAIGVVLLNSPVLDQGAAQARRGRTRSACWRAPPGIGQRAGGRSDVIRYIEELETAAQ
jgi:hypothetical protein